MKRIALLSFLLLCSYMCAQETESYYSGDHVGSGDIPKKTTIKFDEEKLQSKDAEEAWFRCESAYNRRSDLIQGFITIVQQIHPINEKNIQHLLKVREEIISMEMDPITSKSVKKYLEVQEKMTSAIYPLMLEIEKTPELIKDPRIISLINQLEGIENSIQIELDQFYEVTAIPLSS